MKTILTFTLILTILFPASIFACPNEGCVDEELEQRLIDEELLSEVMLIAEDGVVEKEELENLFMLIEEKWGVTPSEFIDDINLEATMWPANSCGEWLIFMASMPPGTLIEGCFQAPERCLEYVFIYTFFSCIYCGYLFLIEDPTLKILLFILDLFIEFP